jgi:hypothetical protein
MRARLAIATAPAGLMRFRLAIAAAALAGLALAPSASAVLLYEQVGSGTNDIRSYDAAGTVNDAQAADDFTVPEGEAWQITAVDAFGGSLPVGGPGTDTANIFLFASGGTHPGNQLFGQSGINVGATATTANQTINFTAPISGAPTLTPGPYWLSIQTAGPYAWAWEVLNAPAQGNPSVWQNPGNGLGTGCSTWAPIASCGIPASAGPDLFFRLNGTLIDSRFSLGHFKLKRHNRIVLAAHFPGAGTAVVQDAATAHRSSHAAAGKRKRAKIKRVSVAIAGAISKNLPIKLTRFAKSKLDRKHKLKIKVKVTFTATGGVPFAQIGRLTLHQR